MRKHRNMPAARPGVGAAATRGGEKARPRAAGRRRTAPRALPVFPLQQTVLYPFTITSLSVESPELIQMLDEVAKGDRCVAFVPSSGAGPGQLAAMGCLGRMVKMLRLPDESRRILVRGLARVKVERVLRTAPYTVAEVRTVSVPEDKTLETEAMAKAAHTQFQHILSTSSMFPDELKVVVHNLDDYSRLADLVADTLTLSFDERLTVLATLDLRKRFEQVLGFLAREEVMLKVGGEIQNKVSSEYTKNQREHFLREQLKAIHEQLGEPPESPDLKELLARIEKAQLPGPAREAAVAEVERLRLMHPAAAEYNVARTYVDWLVSLPWNRFSRDRLDPAKAQRMLDHDHYDLKKVKERILEFLAVLALRRDMKAPILCFVGPPGVGKTSLGQSIARALGRRFVRVSLGGIRDEAEIRGHRRTYVGALPGRIIQNLKRAGTANPVFMLDEIDKLGTDFRGDPSSALLEVLDPQQNNAFSDHYLEVPFDVSNVLFITTANLTDPIPPALRDRMEIISLPGYTQEEKLEIARRFLVPRQIAAAGLRPRQLGFERAALAYIIAEYTSEAGVRNLEREIGSVCRKQARALVEGRFRPNQRRVIKEDMIPGFLGPKRVFVDKVTDRTRPGITTGLAWTSAGGEIMAIEATTVPGRGGLILTGSLGEVMKESGQLAFSLVRSRAAEFGFDPDGLKRSDLHVHVPAGATPKDGPSAGLAIAAAMLSLFTGRAPHPRLAMTGEISLQGRVLPVGGIKEKVLAAARAGVHTILLPKDNAGDIQDELPAEIMASLDLKLVGTVDEALRLVFPEPGA